MTISTLVALLMLLFGTLELGFVALWFGAPETLFLLLAGGASGALIACGGYALWRRP